ncbi:ABC transporter permease [Microbacterium sp. CH12i]|uniref:ABC transporter permease n=1 Tax=Microbacterium sp. CH12i TaxID=1479651 RepID=UPI000461D6C8|nr:ABC transporter permease [Microbacterium sp. CH12i]KDA04806.1 ABC transporter permease [Microbacterium sp. CH12i]
MSTPATHVESPTQLVAVVQAQSRRRKARPYRALLGVAGIVTLFAVWEIAARLGIVDPRFLPPPTEVLPTLLTILTFGDFWAAVGTTMISWGLGLLIALVAGTALGIIVGLSPFMRRATHSTTEFLRPIPSVALIPLAVLLFGARIEASLLLIIYAAFWQIFIQVLYGVADVDQVAMATGRSYGFSTWQRVRSIVFPTTLPYLMTGLRLAAAVALILAVTAQLLIGTPGLGLEISKAQSGGQYTTMYALILATGLLGVLINMGARALERKLLSWHESVRGELPS